jgi:hypothetical protein
MVADDVYELARDHPSIDLKTLRSELVTVLFFLVHGIELDHLKQTRLSQCSLGVSSRRRLGLSPESDGF